MVTSTLRMGEESREQVNLQFFGQALFTWIVFDLLKEIRESILTKTHDTEIGPFQQLALSRLRDLVTASADCVRKEGSTRTAIDLAHAFVEGSGDPSSRSESQSIDAMKTALRDLARLHQLKDAPSSVLNTLSKLTEPESSTPETDELDLLLTLVEKYLEYSPAPDYTHV